jgi:tyrosyl-tRNA synthetase
MITPEEKLHIIKMGLADIIGIEKLEKKILSGENLKVYWGTCPTGPIHLGYLVPLVKIAHLVLADCEVTILLADLHAHLDSVKTSWELLELRTQYYERAIKQILLRMQVDITKIKFVKGSEFQLTTKYTIDVYKLMSKMTLKETQEGIGDIIDQSTNPVLSGLIYPVLQILDEVYLGVGCELGGLDQKKIFMMGCRNLNKIGHESNIYLINNVVPNLLTKNSKNPLDVSTKMSSSGEPESRIDITDDSQTIYKKINLIDKGNCDVLFSYLRNIVFPIIELSNMNNYLGPINTSERIDQIRFNVMVDGSYGDYMGLESYANFEELKLGYQKDIINLHDLKSALSKWIVSFLMEIKKYFSSDEMVGLLARCY